MAALFAAIMTFSTIACTDDNVAFIHFQTVSPVGMEERDTLHFAVDSIPADGTYTTYLCIRTNKEYPYRNISFLVSQQNKSNGTKVRKAIDTETYTETNRSTWKGTARFSTELPVTTVRMQQGDSLTVDIKHNMRRESMPGITDIGIKIVKN